MWSICRPTRCVKDFGCYFVSTDKYSRNINDDAANLQKQVHMTENFLTITMMHMNCEVMSQF